MFLEPVKVGKCPLCGADTYSENDPTNDPTISVRCCECVWWENQFLTWEEMNNMINDFGASSNTSNGKSSEGNYKNLYDADEFIE